MRDFKEPRRSGYADRAAPDAALLEGKRLPIGVHEKLRRGRGGRDLAAIDRVDLALLRVVVEEERPAAQARGARLDEVQRELHRDHRIDRVAAALEHPQPRLDRQRIGRRDHVLLRMRQGLRRPAARRLRLRRAVLRYCDGTGDEE
jgi:hypothetical protein